MSEKLKFVLGSGSPRRKDILSTFAVDFEVLKPEIEEHSEQDSPRLFCEDITRKKFQELRKIAKNKNAIGITGDTIVTFKNEIYGKPTSRDEAYQTLKILSGQEHQVITSIGLGFLDREYISVSSEVTLVRFSELSDRVINYYLSKETYKDKAGSYAIQDPNCFFVSGITGSFSNVIGFPVELFKLKLGELTEREVGEKNWERLL